MRLFLIGATGRIGREILDLALSRGHEVTAFVRSPHKVQLAPSLTVVGGDPLNPKALAAALPGHDAVLSSIGPPPRDGLRPSTLMTDSAASTIVAMKISGVTRLAIVSAAVLFPEKGLFFAFFKWLLRHHARDLSAMEGLVRTSGLDWTIARPPRLTAAPDVQFRALTDVLPPGGRTVSIRSVATFMLDAVEHRAHTHEVVGLAR
jgi:putative NADH-flavin reductase